MGGRPGAPRALAVPTGPLGSAGPPKTAKTNFSCILERLTENWLVCRARAPKTEDKSRERWTEERARYCSSSHEQRRTVHVQPKPSPQCLSSLHAAPPSVVVSTQRCHAARPPAAAL